LQSVPYGHELPTEPGPPSWQYVLLARLTGSPYAFAAVHELSHNGF
jgi:hypothetical protein